MSWIISTILEKSNILMGYQVSYVYKLHTLFEGRPAAGGGSHPEIVYKC